MKKTLMLFIIISIWSCTNQQSKSSHYTEEQVTSLYLDSATVLDVEVDSIIKIDLNSFLKRQHFDFGSLVQEVKLISLETTNESLLSDIYKILITDSNIYVYDKYKGGGVAIFNKNGEFVRRITHGQGPGEVFRLLDIAYDMDQNELILFQHPFLCYYTPLGEFIQTKRLPFGFYNFMVIPNGYLFKSIDRQGNDHLGSLENYTLFVTDKSFRLKSVGMPYSSKGSVLEGYHYLYDNNNEIKVTQGYTDTIYQYITETNSLRAKYVMDYSNKKLPEHYLYGEGNEFRNAIRQEDYYFYLGEYLETESHHAFFLCNWHIGLNTIVYRDKKSGNLIGGTNADLNLSEIPLVGFPKAVSGDYFVNWYFPNQNDSLLLNSSVISADDKEKIKNTANDDNPVLVFFKLKYF